MEVPAFQLYSTTFCHGGFIHKVIYSISDKLAVNVSIKHSQSQANVTHDNGAPESTIHWWVKDKEKLHDPVDVVDARCDEKGPELQNTPTTCHGGIRMVYEGEADQFWIIKLRNYTKILLHPKAGYIA